MKPTRDHGKILQWAERHAAVPAERKIRIFDGEPSLLYFLQGEAAAGTADIRPISWEDFFARFDLLNLSMAFEENSSWFELVRVEQPGEAPRLH